MRFEALDSFRGITAIAIIVAHLRPFIEPSLFPSTDTLYLLVDFFFVLSGFVICYSYGDRLNTLTDVRDFAIRRIGRLWPLHLATLSVLVAAASIKIVAEKLGATGLTPELDFFHFEDIIEQVLLLNSVGLAQLGWNVPSWSIGAEALAYTLFGAMVFSGSGRTWVYLLIVAACLVTIEFVSPENMHMTSRFGVLRGLAGFCTGVLCFEAYKYLRQKVTLNFHQASLLEFAILFATLAFLYKARLSALSYAAPLVFFGFVLVFAQDKGILSRLLKFSPFRTLGHLSYSIYLTHFPLIYILVLIYEAVDPVSIPGSHLPFSADIATALFTVVVVGVSAVTYKYIELPGQAVAKKVTDWLRAREIDGAVPATSPA